MRVVGDLWTLFVRATPLAERRLQPEVFGRLLDPGGVAVGAAATKRSADGLKFRFRLRQVDVFRPVGRLWQRPTAQQRSVRVMRTLVQASPLPVLGTLHQSSP